jgi:hypothetical protein
MPKTKRKSAPRVPGKGMEVAVVEITTAANAWASINYEIPLAAILEQRGGKSFVMEIVQVDLINAFPVTTQPIDSTFITMGARDLTVGTALTPAQALALQTNFFIANTSLTGMLSFDTTDEKGNGVLYPGQDFWINAYNEQVGYVWSIRIMYRITNLNQSDLVALMTQYFIT